MQTIFSCAFGLKPQRRGQWKLLGLTRWKQQIKKIGAANSHFSAGLTLLKTIHIVGFHLIQIALIWKMLNNGDLMCKCVQKRNMQILSELFLKFIALLWFQWLHSKTKINRIPYIYIYTERVHREGHGASSLRGIFLKTFLLFILFQRTKVQQTSQKQLGW